MIIDKEGKFRHRRIAGAVGGRAGGRVVDVRGRDGLRLAGGSQGEGIAEKPNTADKLLLVKFRQVNISRVSLLQKEFHTSHTKLF